MKNFPNKDILEEFLSNCTPAEAYKTILEEEPFYSTTIEMLLAKNNKLINLAIAQTTDDKDLLAKFFDEGDLSLRLAVLGNNSASIASLDEDIQFLNSTENNELVKKIFNFGTDEELQAVIKNLNGLALEDLWEKNGILSNMKVDRWEKIISFSALNIFLNEEGDFLYYSSTLSFWKLFKTLRKNKLNENTLSVLLRKIKNFTNPTSSKSDFDFMEEIFNKWGEHINYFVTKKYAALNSGEYSSLDNNKLLKLCQHKDKNVRRGVYGYLDYSKLTRENIFEFYKKDKSKFIYEAINNSTLYFSYDNKSLNIRNAFYSCMFKDDSHMYRDIFHQNVEKFAIESGVYYPKGELVDDSNYVLDESDEDLSIRSHKDEDLDENLEIQKNILNDLKRANTAYEKLNKNYKYDRIKFLVEKYVSSEHLKVRTTNLLFKRIKKLEEQLQDQSDKKLDINPYINYATWSIIIIISLLILILFK